MKKVKGETMKQPRLVMSSGCINGDGICTSRGCFVGSIRRCRCYRRCRCCRRLVVVVVVAVIVAVVAVVAVFAVVADVTVVAVVADVTVVAPCCRCCCCCQGSIWRLILILILVPIPRWWRCSVILTAFFFRLFYLMLSLHFLVQIILWLVRYSLYRFGCPDDHHQETSRYGFSSIWCDSDCP